jgi:hypothetical protein
MYHEPFWAAWSDGTSHASHQRVLARVKHLGEG